MPTILVDTEQAELMEAAFAMFEAALRARVKRADPDQIISNSLILQANKLKSVRGLLTMPEAPSWSDMDPGFKAKALRAMVLLTSDAPEIDHNAALAILRGVINAPGFPVT